MKLIKKASGHNLSLKKSEWESIGEKAGWTKSLLKQADKYEIVDDSFNRANYPDMIGKIVDTPPSYAKVKLIKDDKPSLDDIFRRQSKMWTEDKAEHMPEDFAMKALRAGYDNESIIEGLGKWYRQAPDAASSILSKAVSKMSL